MENGVFRWLKELTPWPEVIGALLAILLAIGTFYAFIMGQARGLFGEGERRAEKRAEEYKTALKQSEERLLGHIKDLKDDAKEREDRLMTHIQDLKADAKDREDRLLETIRDLRNELKDARQERRAE